MRLQIVVLLNELREGLCFSKSHQGPKRIVDFDVVQLLQGEISSELGDRAAHNSNFDWIDALVGTEVDEVALKSSGTLCRRAANPCMQGVDLLDLEVLGSFLVSAVTVCIVLPADV